MSKKFYNGKLCVEVGTMPRDTKIYIKIKNGNKYYIRAKELEIKQVPEEMTQVNISVFADKVSYKGIFNRIKNKTKIKLNAWSNEKV